MFKIITGCQSCLAGTNNNGVPVCFVCYVHVYLFGEQSSLKGESEKIAEYRDFSDGLFGQDMGTLADLFDDGGELLFEGLFPYEKNVLWNALIVWLNSTIKFL